MFRWAVPDKEWWKYPHRVGRVMQSLYPIRCRAMTRRGTRCQRKGMNQLYIPRKFGHLLVHSCDQHMEYLPKMWFITKGVSG